MKILVTGGMGFLGQNLVERLCKNARDDIVVLSRSSKPLTVFDPHETKNVRIVTGADIESYDSIKKHFEGIDVVYHLAARIEYDRRCFEKDYKTNVEGTLNVLRACEEHNVKTMVNVSTVSTFGYCVENETITEQFCFDWKRNSYNAYMQSKFIAEQKLRERATGKTRVVTANPAVIVGPGGTGNILKLFRHIKKAKVLFAPSGSVNIVDVRDVASALTLLAEKGKHLERYLVSGTNTNWVSLFQNVAALFRRNTAVHRIPQGIGRAVTRFISLLELLGLNLESRKITSKHIDMSFRHVQVSNDKLRSLGWSPKYSLDQTLQDALSWYVGNGYL